MSINYNDSIYNGISFISSLILLLLYSLILILSKQKGDKISTNITSPELPSDECATKNKNKIFYNIPNDLSVK